MVEVSSKPPKARSASALTAVLTRFGPSARILLSFALGMVLLVLGAFLAWQASLVWQVDHGAAQADGVRATTIAAITKEIEEREARFELALNDASVQQPLAQDSAEGRSAAKTAPKGAALPPSR